MNKQKTIKAFTLIELIVWIAIVSIMMLWISQIDFNRLSLKQELEILTNNIKSNHELVRNNSLSWKWVWLDLIVPDWWKIGISKIWSWTITNNYLSWWLRQDLKNEIVFKPWMHISWLRCLQIDWVTEDTVIDNTSTWEILYNGIWLTLSWACDQTTSKILEITLENLKTDTKKIEINTLNWIAEVIND